MTLVVAGLLFASCASAQECNRTRTPRVRPGVCPPPVAERQPVPDVALPVLLSDAPLAAGATELSDLDRRVIVVNFWASWCGPCRIEQPDLSAVDALPPDHEVVLVGVNIEDTEANALVHLAEFNVPYLSLLDQVNELAGRIRGIGARTIPSTVFIDAECRVAARLQGLTDTREIAALTRAVASAD